MKSKIELAAMWREFEVEEFPENGMGRAVDGLTFEQVDAVAAGCVSTFLRTGALDDECLALLDGALARLDRIVLAAGEEARPYFTRLLAIASDVRAAARPGGIKE